MNVLEQSLIRWLSISEFWRDFLLGFLILLAVATDSIIMNRIRDYWARETYQQAAEPAAVSQLPAQGSDSDDE